MTRPSAAKPESSKSHGQTKARPVTSSTAPILFETVSSGLKSRKLVLLSRITSRT